MRKSYDRIAWLLMVAWMLNVWTTNQVAWVMDRWMPVDFPLETSAGVFESRPPMMVMVPFASVRAAEGDTIELNTDTDIDIDGDVPMTGYAGFVIELDDDATEPRTEAIESLVRERSRRRLFVPMMSKDYALAVESLPVRIPRAMIMPRERSMIKGERAARFPG